MSGLYRYNFLPFGLNVSPSIFQECINEVIKDLQGVKAYQDDLIVYGKDKQQHNERVISLLNRLLEKNVSINASKSVFGVHKLEYLGFIVEEEGYRPDPTRLDPFINAPAPDSHAALRSTLGILQYYSRFIPNFATKAEPLF